MHPASFAILFGWFVCPALGAWVGSKKEAGGTGLILGLFFGPLGLLLAFAADGRPRCPACKGRHSTGAKVCPHCRKGLRGRTAEEAAWASMGRMNHGDDWEQSIVDRR